MQDSLERLFRDVIPRVKAEISEAQVEAIRQFCIADTSQRIRPCRDDHITEGYGMECLQFRHNRV